MNIPRVALITGGAKGIGRAIGLDLAAAGWEIAFCYRSSEREAADTAVLLQKSGRRVLVQQCDVSIPDQASTFAKKVEGEFGSVDALINGAGPYHRVNILEETPKGWRDMLANNLDSVFYMTRAIAPGMKADLVLWDVERPGDLAYPLGFNPCAAVIKNGALVRGSLDR